MTIIDLVTHSIGDLDRFGRLQERVEVLIDDQLGTWTSDVGGWLVLPLQRQPLGFYLLSEDREGQRRGREVLQAFLGTNVGNIESVPLTPTASTVDEALQQAGLTHLSLIRRTSAPADEMLRRVEDAIATVKTKDARQRPLQLSHVELLRDFRLSLQHRDTAGAERALDSLRRTGRLSAENLRFLTVEMYRRLERWRDLRELPYLTDLLRARRPRTTNEALLEMLWWTELADQCAAGRTPQSIYSETDLGGRYGSVLGSVDVPAEAAGRAVALIAALALNDADRVDRLLAAPTDDAERNLLHQLLGLSRPTEGKATPLAEIRALFDDGRFSAVVRMFVETPDPAIGDLAVQAVLETDDSGNAAAVLTFVEALIEDHKVQPDRRLSRDLADLRRLASGSCAGWREWCARLNHDERWPDAAQVLRTQSPHWNPLSALPAADIRDAANDLLGAWTGINQDQVLTALDLLCAAAAETVAGGQPPELCDVVLLILAEQHNLSAPVREAYLQLLEQILESGPTDNRYQDLTTQTDALWRRVASPAAVDWGLALMDVLLNAPSPLPDLRASVGMELVNKIRSFRLRLTARQRSDAEALAEELGLASQEEVEPPDDDLWHRLDGSIIGLYSLLPRAAESLQRRLSHLCTPASVDSNTDTVATAALRTLATRADYLIVDTWHAAHAATGAIDEVRPRSQQILPKGRGVTGFMQALEDRLTSM